MIRYSSDNDFIEGFRNNDDRAVTAFYDKYHKLFWGTLGKNFNSLPEDDLESSFIDSLLFVKDAVVRGRFNSGNLKAYFMKTAQYKVYETARKAGYKLGSEKKTPEEINEEIRKAGTFIEPKTKVVYRIEDAESMFLEDNSPSEIRRKELYQKLDDIMKTLPEKCQQIFHLHLNLGKSMKEIAPILGYENDRVVITKNKKCKVKLIDVANTFNLASYL